MAKIHILNGDALKSQFPPEISGEKIVLRECLVDGNVQGKTLKELFFNRAIYLENYDAVPFGEYSKTTIPELDKIINIEPNREICCWFEDDLFCQVNFWFTLFLFKNKVNQNKVFLVRPNKGNEYSFGHMSQIELKTAYEQRVFITTEELVVMSQLWPLYQKGNYIKMLKLAEELPQQYHFLTPAIHAQIARIPDKNGFGRPERSLLNIINELNTQDFTLVFREFGKREAIYSFGDMQVKVMFDKLLLRMNKI